jgi:hypothetical protein
LTIGFVFFQLLNISLCQIFRAPFAVVTPAQCTFVLWLLASALRKFGGRTDHEAAPLVPPDHSSVQINAVSAA